MSQHPAEQLSLVSLFTGETLPEAEVVDSPAAEQSSAALRATSEEESSIPARELAPMMQQYVKYKEQYPEHLVLLQVGDFYEIFFNDAVRASEVLNIRLTSRSKESPNPIPMAGVPIHALDNYLPRLLSAGCSCVVISQTEDGKDRRASGGKGMMQREISRIVTPGVRFEGDGLDESSFNFLAAALARDDGSSAVALVDVSTGWLRVYECEGHDELVEVVRRVRPSEILLPSTIQAVAVDRSSGWFKELSRVAEELGVRTVLRPAERALRANLERRIGEAALKGREQRFSALSLEGLQSLQLILHYVDEIAFGNSARIARFSIEEPSRVATIDAATRRNLELVETRIDGEKKHSLLGHLNFARTAMGSRLLTEYLLNPSADREEILRRHDAVQELVDDPANLASLRQALCSVRDIDRIVSRVTGGRAVPKDLALLRESLREVPTVLDLLAQTKSTALKSLSTDSDRLQDVYARLAELLTSDPPFRLTEGGICRDGFNAEVDRLRSISQDGSTWLLNLEQRERAATGITGLKVKYNNVFGYFIEISKANLEKVPSHYERRQTLVNAERFVIGELKEFEASVLSSKARLLDLERELFLELRAWVSVQAERVQGTAAALAELDVLCSFAYVAYEYGYVRPKLTDARLTRIVGGRHPVVERVVGQENFIRNDTLLDGAERRFAILTGPNMGGKSTYLRQVGLIQLLAQAGSFVPAEQAELGIVDRIFTRIGAADDLARGDSTFMVEMRETATILRRATDRSLVLIDEIGRGTATGDGLAIATAIAEWLHDRTHCNTLFATHFHELTGLATTQDGAFCLSVGVVEDGEEIIFTHRIEEGAASRSYGIEVARLAGLPAELVLRAGKLLEGSQTRESSLERVIEGKMNSTDNLPSQTTVSTSHKAVAEDEKVDRVGELLIKRLKGYSVHSMTPLQALIEINELQGVAEDATDKAGA